MRVSLSFENFMISISDCQFTRNLSNTFVDKFIKIILYELMKVKVRCS